MAPSSSMLHCISSLSPDAPDWIIRRGSSSWNRRHPDWIIQGPVADRRPELDHQGMHAIPRKGRARPAAQRRAR